MIRFACPACKKVLKVADDGAGKKVNCPGCGQRLLIPAAPMPVVPVRDRVVLAEAPPSPPTSSPVSASRSAPPKVRQGKTIPVTCPGCRRQISLPVAELGTMIECAQCSARFVPTRAAAPSASSGDDAETLGFRTDAEVARQRRPAALRPRSWAGIALALLALALGVSALPLGLVYSSQPLGIGLAGLGVFFGIVGLCTAVLRGRGRGFGLSLLGAAVCGSALAVGIMLLGKGHAPDDRWAQFDTALRNGADNRKDEPGGGREAKVDHDGSEGPPVPDKPKPVEKPNRTDPDFDANDMERTMKWIDKVNDDLAKEQSSNGVRYRAALDKFNNESRAYAGTKVRWVMTVASISKREVILQVDKSRSGEVVTLGMGDGITKEKAAGLNRGDRITITAEVIEVKAEGPGASINLKNVRAE
jgi:DNA-directed RNA polymerase subunit RPC12/RpoP